MVGNLARLNARASANGGPTPPPLCLGFSLNRLIDLAERWVVGVGVLAALVLVPLVALNVVGDLDTAFSIVESLNPNHLDLFTQQSYRQQPQPRRH